MNKLHKLKKEYDDTEIPPELEHIVITSIRQAKASQKKHLFLKKWAVGAVAAATLFVGSINMSPSFAEAMAHVPVLGSIVEVFTVQQLTVDDETYQANLQTPAVSGLDDERLQSLLNEKYIQENEALFQQFQQDVEMMKQAGDGHLGMDSGYEILTDTAQLLSIARYEVNTVASSSTTMKYDTIDKQNSFLITLPSLFKDDRYVDVISTYIANEMTEQMTSAGTNLYFLSEDGKVDFEKINSNQDFYITRHHKLVISFDKYEVGPGFMGIVTFEIPTEILSDLLVSNTYIR